ncbi:MAG: class I adenylate-forming enzyme family protein [Reyranellaceae bacterium]
MVERADETIPQLLERLARENRDGVAVSFRDRQTGFGALAAQADAVSNWCVDAGLRAGDRVALLMPPSDEWLAIFYGVIGAGCIAVPLNLAFKADELRFVLGQSRARCLIAAESHRGVDLAGRVEEAAPGLASAPRGGALSAALPALERALLLGGPAAGRGGWGDARDLPSHRSGAQTGQEMRRRRAAMAPGDTCAIVYTSGSTSFPKPAQLHHRGLLGGAWWYGESAGITPQDRMLSFAPTFHVSGLSAGALLAHVRGMTLWLLDGFEPGAMLDLIERHRITLFGGFDTMFASMLQHPRFAPQRVASVRSLIMATGPAMYERVKAGFPGLQVMARCYAMTETCGPTALTRPDMRSLDALKRSNGVPIPGMRIRIADPATGRDRPTGETGEIRLKGWAVFNGYLDMAAETEAAFDAEGWLKTGDLGHFDGEGLLYLTGRLKRMIKTGGENVSEREVELFIEDRVPGVALAQVVGIPDPAWGEAVIAFVEPLPGAVLDEAAVTAACKSGLANFKVPKRVLFLREQDWPRNDIGKIAKDALTALAVTRTTESPAA